MKLFTSYIFIKYLFYNLSESYCRRNFRNGRFFLVTKKKIKPARPRQLKKNDIFPKGWKENNLFEVEKVRLKVSTSYGQHHWKNSALVNRVFIIFIYFLFTDFLNINN